MGRGQMSPPDADRRFCCCDYFLVRRLGWHSPKDICLGAVRVHLATFSYVYRFSQLSVIKSATKMPPLFLTQMFGGSLANIHDQYFVANTYVSTGCAKNFTVIP